MRIVEITSDFINNGIVFKKGHSYVMAEDVESQYRSLYGGAIGMSYPIERSYRPYKGENLNGKRIFSWRTGGIGDILFISPVLRYLKNKYPDSFIRFASACKYGLENVPEINELYDMPFDAQLLNDVDYHLQFQGIIEGESDASKRTHAVDLFFSYFSIDSTHFPDEYKRPRLFFTQQEMEWLNRTCKEMGIKEQDYVIGIQMESSSPLRNYPKEKLKQIVDILVQEENVKIVMIGSDQHTVLAQWFKGNNPNILIGTRFSVRQSIILAVRYNLVIAPDSFMIQVAGALEKPLIGLYGPFSSEVRMKYFKNAIGLDPRVVCSPCYKHDFRACIRGFPSPCFTRITIEDVLQAVDYLKTRFTGRHFSYMREFLKDPDLSEAEKYMLSADKGVCFFCGYYEHPNIIRVDPNPFVKADISNLSEEFKRDFYPFVVYMNEFSSKYRSVYDNSKSMVRPGGHYIAYKRNSNEELFLDIKRDLGKNFILLFSKLDPGTGEMLIIGKKPY